MKIYLDVCCLNRWRDDQRQDRIRLEAEAVRTILARVSAGQWEWVGSEVMELEIDKTPDPERRHDARILLTHVRQTVPMTRSEMERAEELRSRGFMAMDALHLACAESGGADVFLTTDDRLLRLALRHLSAVKVRVENPLTWLREVVQ